MNTDDIDKFGHCVICHRYLLTRKVVDGKIVDMFLPIYDETFFLLNNGSQMQVTICKPCKQITNLSDPIVHDNIMRAVQKGWILENKLLVADPKIPEWTAEFGDKYLANQAKLSIDIHSEGLDKFEIQTRQMQILNKTVEPLPVEEVDNGFNINS